MNFVIFWRRRASFHGSSAKLSGCPGLSLRTRDDITDLRQNSGKDLMTTGVRQFDDVSTSIAELTGQSLGDRGWDHRVPLTVGDHHQGSREISCGWFGVRDHGREQHRSPEETWPLEKHGGYDIGPVRESNGDQRALLDPVLCAGSHHKFGKLIGSTAEVVLVEHSFAEPTEKPGHAVLQHCPAHR